MKTTQQRFTSQEQGVLDTFQRHVTSFTAGNLDAVLDDFAEHAVVMTPDGVFEGWDRIRALYQGLLAEFGTIDKGDSPGISVDALHVRHNTLFISWHAESTRHIFPFGADMFVCDGDKIERQSIAFSPPRARA
jgi:ketosteroid isomerase-like protein